MEASEWPDFIEYALERLSKFDTESKRACMARFRRRWRGVAADTLTHVGSEGSGEDKLFAIWALGELKTAEARDVLQSQLESSVPMERWASAISLGEMGERHALPALQLMLTDFLPKLEEQRVTAG